MLRSLILALTLCLSGFFLEAQEVFFCDDPGKVLVYERHYVTDGKLKWRHEMEIESVSKRSGADIIKYSSSFFKPSGGIMYSGPVELVAVVDAVGDVQMDLALSLASVFSNFVGESKVAYDACLSVLPSGMSPGDVLEDAQFVVSVLGMKYKVAVTQRYVLRSESLQTPAGDFDCVVVQEHKVEKGPGRNRETTALTWYAKGVGMVRHDTYDKNMILETSEVLTSIR